jgi:flagellar biosynthetic protein FliQ
MDSTQAVNLGREVVMLTLLLALPVLLAGFLVAAVTSLLQALTQVQEQTLSFIPKIVAMLLTGAIFGPWMLTRLVEFSQKMFSHVP